MSGIQFVRNFLGRSWQNERKQDVWAVEPIKDSLQSLRFLYHVKEHAIFGGLRLVFEIKIHDEHPYKAPTIKVRTPNGRMLTDTSICIDGLTAWHPESWNIITSMGGIVERFMVAFLDLEGVKEGVGFVKNPVEVEMRSFAHDSLRWNKETFPDIMLLFQEQCDDLLCATLSDDSSALSTSSASVDEDYNEFIYEEEEEVSAVSAVECT